MIDNLKHKGDFSNLLLHWNRTENNREMPWKQVRDPYKIWLSEIILQQTRVEQGRSYYESFISQFPDVHALAKASDSDVFKLWEGLGYYSRCKNLIYTARFINNTLDGVFPNSYESLLELKGVGPYTAAAISSFAFDIPQAVLDGNVIRVLARFFGIDAPYQNQSGKAIFQDLAQFLLDKENPAEYNQAIMDFGATVCKPKGALCSECPMANKCQAFLSNRVSELPFKISAKAKKIRWMVYVVAKFEDEVLIRLRTEKDIWQNLNEFILFESPTEMNPTAVLQDNAMKKSIGSSYEVVHISEGFQHILTHQQLYLRFIIIHLKQKITTETHHYKKWNDLAEIAFPKAIIRFLETQVSS
jgi:A/G-specific adenine glycosylase